MYVACILKIQRLAICTTINILINLWENLYEKANNWLFWLNMSVKYRLTHDLFFCCSSKHVKMLARHYYLKYNLSFICPCGMHYCNWTEMNSFLPFAVSNMSTLRRCGSLHSDFYKTSNLVHDCLLHSIICKELEYVMSYLWLLSFLDCNLDCAAAEKKCSFNSDTVSDKICNLSLFGTFWVFWWFLKKWRFCSNQRIYIKKHNFS